MWLGKAALPLSCLPAHPGLNGAQYRVPFKPSFRPKSRNSPLLLVGKMLGSMETFPTILYILLLWDYLCCWLMGTDLSYSHPPPLKAVQVLYWCKYHVECSGFCQSAAAATKGVFSAGTRADLSPNSFLPGLGYRDTLGELPGL